MTMLIIQTALLLAIAYILGCILGCLLHQWFAAEEAPAVATAAAAAGTAATLMRTPPPPPPPPAPAPQPVAAPAPARKPPARKAPARKKPAAPRAKDDLKRIRGIGRQNEARLNAIGVSSFAQIAAWSKKDQADIGDRLAFPGRIEREEWVKQAKVLAKGGETAFSKRVRKGEVSTSTGKGDVGELGKKPPVLKSARGGKGDNLTLIDGVGNAIEKKLNAMGIYHFDQIAKWSEDHANWIGNELGFPGRVQRENWIGESRVLASGGMTEHARRVEAGEIGTSRKSTTRKKK